MKSMGQKKDAVEKFAIKEFVELPQELKYKLGNLSPNDVYPFANELKNSYTKMEKMLLYILQVIWI